MLKEQASSVSSCHWAFISLQFNTAITAVLSTGIAVRERIVTYGWGLNSLSILPPCAMVVMLGALVGCTGPSASLVEDTKSRDPFSTIRGADLSARIPTAEGQSQEKGQSQESGQSAKPLLFPGADVAADVVPNSRRGPDPAIAPASFQQAAFVKGDNLQQDPSSKSDGVEINFEGADVQTVAKFLLGDILQLNFTVDPRVQGNVTLASAGPIPRKDVLPAFESVLRMSNAAIVRSGNLVKIVPLPEAGGGGSMGAGAGEPGFGVSLVSLRYTSAETVAKTAESFLARPGSIRIVPSRNLLLIQGTTAERQAALDMVATFDVEWLRNQSVGVYPLKSTSPETMIGELERIFETRDGGVGQGVIRFQPISRMNAVMVVTKTPKLLTQTTEWVRRLDRIDSTGTTLRTFRLKNGNATQVAKILNDIFGQRSGSTDTAIKQIAPGVDSAQSRLDSLDKSSGNGGMTTASNNTGNKGANPISASFDTFSDRKGTEADGPEAASLLSGGNAMRGAFQNVRITADAANNAIVVYSTQDEYRVVERAIRDLDRAKLQVAINATVAEVTLTNALQYGVQFFLNGQNVSGAVLGPGAATAQSSAVAAASATVQSALLQSVGPGLNLLLGSAGNPRAILNALQTVTDVKVLSSPSLVALDNQPALLQVGDEIPVTTSSAAVLSNSTTPIVNTIEMRNTGVILKVLPHIHANGSIQLEIDQEISNVVNPDQQTLTPTISQRRVHSSVSVVSGQTVLLAGLISESSQETRSGIPGLREIKFLGDVFGNTSSTKSRSEIIIFIKTQLIRNSQDASGVTEEFRDRLQSMRSGSSIINGTGMPPTAGPHVHRQVDNND
jgi:general secretion pathway protein D